MLKDRFDQSISAASARAVERNDDAVDRLFALQPGAEALVDEALAADADFALAHCTKARTLLQNGDSAGARRWARRAQELAAPLPERERSHAEIVCRAIHGESATALRMVRDHAAAWPRDAVPFSFALGVYGLLGFGGFKDFEAQQVALLDSVAPAWGEGDWWFLAAHGWARVEFGDVERGIALLERALERNAANANAVHGRAHGYYEQGAAAEGDAFIAAWLPGYSREAVLHGHLAWHRALFALQSGDVEQAVRVYKDAVAPDASSALPMFTMIDSASFLFRHALHGHARDAALCRRLADYASEHFPKPGAPFVNVHLAMAHALMEDHGALDRLAEGVAAKLAEDRQASGPVVASVCAAIADYGARRHDAAAAIAALLPETARLGGSRAQRDVFADLAVAALLRSGDAKSAAAVARERHRHRAGHLDHEWLRRVAAGIDANPSNAAPERGIGSGRADDA